jgi:2-polyprenyl-6-hydroxyphenyl methylase/3-demethylubiquinone-9 3-methyltransferase
MCVEQSDTAMPNLTDRSTHFEFGKNWKGYSRRIDDARIQAAVGGLRKLFPEGLHGQSVLDIGCGSGVHAVAALRIGAKFVRAVDIDEDSVSTARDLLAKCSPGGSWRTDLVSVFDLVPEGFGGFDVVYSWGVLHHTGDMWTAIRRAAALVNPSGCLAIAIYAATPFDPFWKVEKEFYAKSPRAVQWIIRQVYMAAFMASQVWLKQNPIRIIRERALDRGMSFTHDAHDWLGGYPYETADPTSIVSELTSLGFHEVRSFILPGTSGMFGSGCNEFVFVKNGATSRWWSFS